jgi:hypothetical protein
VHAWVHAQVRPTDTSDMDGTRFNRHSTHIYSTYNE